MHEYSNIIGTSDAIKEVFALMEKAILSGSDVLITGEAGTGKELIAKEIHYNSPRKERPLFVCNCSAIPGDMLLNQLLGHGKDAFPDAMEDRIGFFEAAEGSTLILDEIDTIPGYIQTSLAYVLAERKIQPLGETTFRSIDVRVIAITSRDLPKLVETGNFKEDLYAYLKAFEIPLPPLRERSEDIPLLIEHFYQEACRQLRKTLTGFAPNALEMLSRYPWPGNVRELRSVVRRACALTGGVEQIQIHHLPSQIFHPRR